jgi:hypothetical protein
MTMFQQLDSVGTAHPLDSFPPKLQAKFGDSAGGVEIDCALVWQYVQPHHHGQAGITMLQGLYTEQSRNRR